MKRIYEVADPFGNIHTFNSKETANIFIKLKRKPYKESSIVIEYTITEGIEFDSKEEEQLLSEIMKDCFLRGVEQGRLQVKAESAATEKANEYWKQHPMR